MRRKSYVIFIFFEWEVEVGNFICGIMIRIDNSGGVIENRGNSIKRKLRMG